MSNAWKRVTYTQRITGEGSPGPSKPGIPNLTENGGANRIPADYTDSSDSSDNRGGSTFPPSGGDPYPSDGYGSPRR